MRQCHRQNFWLETGALAGRTRHFAHISFVPLPHTFGIGLLLPALQERNNAFEARIIRTLATVTVFVTNMNLVIDAMQNSFLNLGGEFFPRITDTKSQRVS